MLKKYDHKVHEIEQMIAGLMDSIVEGNEYALDGYVKGDTQAYERARAALKTLEADADKIDNEIIKTFALFGPEAQELRTLVTYLKMNNELVRIGVGTRKYARRIQEHCQSDCDLSPFDNVIVQLHKSAIGAMKYIRECFVTLDTCDVEENYRKVMVEESKNDDLFSILEKDIMTNIISESELSIEYVKVLGTLRKLERIGDRAVNIANLMVYAKKGGQMAVYGS